MIGLSRWCIAHRRWVVAGWIAIAIGTTAFASAVGRQYANNFSLPGTEAQRVTNLLNSQFKAQSGDSDTIVFHSSRGSIDAPGVRAAVEPVLARVSTMPHVVSVISPYSGAGALEISRDRRTAFATVNYDKRANLLPDKTGQPLLDAINAVKVPGLELAAGGQVIEQAEGFNIGPATGVGVVAAMVILLLTFGSVVAAGMPLVTAGLGLITGIALVGLATHLTSMSNVAPELAIMIGLGVGVDYALFIVTRFRENYDRVGDVSESIIQAMDTSGRAILLAGTTVIIALLGMFATSVTFLYGLSIASVLAVLMTLLASLTVLPALLSAFGHRLVRPTRKQRRRAAAGAAPPPSTWRRWSLTVQAHPRPLALAALLVMVLFLVPTFGLRLDSSDAGNDPPGTSTQRAFNLLSHGFGAGFNGPLLIAAELHRPGAGSSLEALRTAIAHAPGVVTVTPPRVAPSGRVAVMEAYPTLGSPGSGDHGPGQPVAPTGSATVQAPARRQAGGRRVHRRLDRLLQRAVGQAAAVHRNRGRALGAAAVRDLPVAGDSTAGGVDEPAQHRRSARRHHSGVPGRMAGGLAGGLARSGRTMDSGAHVRGRVRTVDGLRGVPDQPRARGVGAPPRRL